MRRAALGSTLVFALGLALTGIVWMGGASGARGAQESTPAASASHPIVGAWVVDTVSASPVDSPEIGIFMPNGSIAGLGANRVAGGSWEVIDERSVMLTLVTVSDLAGVGSYAIVRGPHTVDESGNAWTCACTFTVVGADGVVIDSGEAPANALRVPVQGTEITGMALDEVPFWQPSPATPTS